MSEVAVSEFLVSNPCPSTLGVIMADVSPCEPPSLLCLGPIPCSPGVWQVNHVGHVVALVEGSHLRSSTELKLAILGSNCQWGNGIALNWLSNSIHSSSPSIVEPFISNSRRIIGGISVGRSWHWLIEVEAENRLLLVAVGVSIVWIASYASHSADPLLDCRWRNGHFPSHSFVDCGGQSGE